MFTFSRLVGWLGLVLGMLGANPALAQSSSPWPITRLDSVASVRMPYAGTVDEEASELGLTIYSTSTSDNDFDALVFIPVPNTAQPLGPDQYLVPDVDRFLSMLMKVPNKSFSKAKLKSSFSVTLPSAPRNQAVHQVYAGFDNFHQVPAALELTWVLLGPKLYVFRCSYSLPEERGAAEDRQHFFSTITFETSRP